MSVVPDRLNLSVWKDTTFQATLTYYTDDTGVTLRNLTGYTALMEIKDTPTGSVIATWSTANGLIVLGGSLGTITITVPATTVAGYTWRSGVYDLLITSPSGFVDALLFGSFTITGY